jgi:hypothetical protein
LIGLKSGHGGDEYEMLVDAKGTLLMQLHRWDSHHHPHLGDPNLQPVGNGALIWWEVDDFDAACARAKKLEAKVLDGPLVNPNAQHRELWLRDLDGYTVVLASKFGDL